MTTCQRCSQRLVVYLVLGSNGRIHCMLTVITVVYADDNNRSLWHRGCARLQFADSLDSLLVACQPKFWEPKSEGRHRQHICVVDWPSYSAMHASRGCMLIICLPGWSLAESSRACIIDAALFVDTTKKRLYFFFRNGWWWSCPYSDVLGIQETSRPYK